MSDANNAEGAGGNVGVFRRPEPSLLKPHLFAGHDLIPLNRPNALRSNRHIGKAPRDNNWRKRDYSGQSPSDWMTAGFNVGVLLRPEQLVVDVDPRNFGGADRLAELCERFGIKLDDFPYVRSGGGGQHIYMAKPKELAIRTKLDAFPGIDFKTHGNQVVAAGSVHPETGRHYRAEDPLGALLLTPSAPENLLQALAKIAETVKPNTAGRISSGRLSDLLGLLSPTDYRDPDAWLKLMMACHHATGGAGLDAFVAWSVLDPQYAARAEEITPRWNSLSLDRDGLVTSATLFKAVNEAGGSDLVREITAYNDFDDPSEFAPAAGSPRRFTEMSLDDLELIETPRWLIQNLIPEGGLAVVYGQPKAGKTFWAIDLSLSVASGTNFHGLTARSGRVTYLAAEGGPARLRDRARAWLKARELDKTVVSAWRLIARRADLSDPAEVKWLLDALNGSRDLVVVDTLARSMTGDENSQKDMGAFIAGCDQIREATGSAVLIVHHEGKDAAKGARGSNVLRGAVDTGIRVRRDGGGAIVATVEDQRDGDAILPMNFELRNVVLDGIEEASAALFATSGRGDNSSVAILEIAAGMIGSTKSKLDAAVAEELSLGRSTAVRRTHNAIGIGKERAVRHGDQVLWFDRADKSNTRSALILCGEAISDIGHQ